MVNKAQVTADGFRHSRSRSSDDHNIDMFYLDHKPSTQETEAAPTAPCSSPTNRDSLQTTLSENFQKTVQEWERIKSKRQPETSSPIFDLPNIHLFKDDRHKQRDR